MMNMKKYINNIEKILDKLSIDWNRFDNKSVLITGATGMVGRAVADMMYYGCNRFGKKVNIYILTRSLKKAEALFGDKIKNNVLKKESEEKNIVQIKFIQGDVCEKMDYPKIDFIVHAAGYGDPQAFSVMPVEVMKANLTGTERMLELAKANDARIIYISTGEVYGRFNADDGYSEENIGELDFNMLRSCYPESKRAAEVFCRSYSAEYGVDFTIARLCHTYGPTMTERDSRVLSYFIRLAAAGKDIIIKSAGLQKRSICYVTDAASAIIMLLLEGKSGEPYNIASHNSQMRIYEMGEILSEIAGTKLIYENASEQEKSGYSKSDCQILNGEKIKKIGWRAFTDPVSGMRITVDDLRDINKAESIDE